MIDVPLRRVCIVMMSAVGDAVHVLPVINAIKRHSPDVHITWVLQPGPATLVRGHRSVDEISSSIAPRDSRRSPTFGASSPSRAFDLVINLQVYFKAGIVTTFTRAPVKLGFDRARARDFNWLFTTHRIPPHAPQHVQDQYFEFLTALNVPARAGRVGSRPVADTSARAQRELLARFERPVGVDRRRDEQGRRRTGCPSDGPRSSTRCGHDFGLQPVLVGGRSPRELHAEQVILERAKHAPHSALGSGLRNLVGILDASSLVLAPDTGPLHMAVALDRPVVSLIGYTNPKRTGPYRKFHDLIVDAYGDPGENYPNHAWRIASIACRASRCATCSIASSAGGPSISPPSSGPKS